MHAYLIVGTDAEATSSKIKELTKKLGLASYEFPAKKIEDIRKLNSFTKLALAKPTAVILYSIEEATEEALNALLKNLEEPQENLYYILTASFLSPLPPTIISRCQIIAIRNSKLTINNEGVEGFLKMSVDEKLLFVDKIKDREKAIEFVENFITYCHELLHKTGEKYDRVAAFLKSGQKAYKSLKANGNVTLQLANFVISLSS